jgi:hypothetical protein
MAPAERSRPFARIREEFERLIEVPARERGEELERLGRDDERLAREVAALLAADGAASALLDGTVERYLGLFDEGDGEAPPAAPSSRFRRSGS